MYDECVRDLCVEVANQATAEFAPGHPAHLLLYREVTDSPQVDPPVSGRRPVCTRRSRMPYISNISSIHAENQ